MRKKQVKTADRPGFRENWRYYRQRLFVLVNLMAVIFGLIGNYQYYRLKIAETWKLISAVLFGTIRMYFFFPMAGETEPVTVFFIIGKWLAPFCTSVAAFSLLGVLFLHQRNKLRYRFSEKQVVFGYNRSSQTLMQNSLRQLRRTRTALVVPAPLPMEVQKELEQQGILVIVCDFREHHALAAKALAKSLRLNHAKSLILFEDHDFDNFALFTTLLSLLEPRREINLCIQCESPALRGLIRTAFAAALTADQPASPAAGAGSDAAAQMADADRTRQSPLTRLNLTFFDDAELIARSLFLLTQDEARALHRVNLERLAGSGLNAFSPVGQISAALGPAHLLFVGYNAVTEYLMVDCLNHATFSLSERIVMTVVDRNAAQHVDHFLGRHHQVQPILDLRAVSVDVGVTAFHQALAAITEEGPPVTYIFLNFRDSRLNLEALGGLSRHFVRIPVAFRNETGLALDKILQLPGNPSGALQTFTYGRLSSVISPATVVHEAMDQQARRYNDNYNETAGRFERGGGSAWAGLSLLKKESSRAVAAHNGFKEAVYRTLHDCTDCRADMEQAITELSLLYDQRTDWPSFNAALKAYLEANPVLNFLSQLEHKRWCHFHYARNYVYDEVRDDLKLRHNCLIDDWELVIGEQAEICYPIFDVVCVLAMFSEDLPDLISQGN